jgi:hypothetical protein
MEVIRLDRGLQQLQLDACDREIAWRKGQSSHTQPLHTAVIM